MSSYRQETRGDKNRVTHEAAATAATDSLPSYRLSIDPLSPAHPRPSSHPSMTPDDDDARLLDHELSNCPSAHFRAGSGGTSPSLSYRE